MNFLLAAAFHMLCSADDLTLHVTHGDRAHSWGRKTVGGPRAHSFQLGVRTEADLVTRHWDHFRTSCQSISQSSLPEMHPSSIIIAKPHRPWDSFVKQNTLPMCEQFYLCMLLFFPICFFSAVYHFLKIELSSFTQSVIHTFLLLRKMTWIRNRWNFRSKKICEVELFLTAQTKKKKE